MEKATEYYTRLTRQALWWYTMLVVTALGAGTGSVLYVTILKVSAKLTQ